MRRETLFKAFLRTAAAYGVSWRSDRFSHNEDDDQTPLRAELFSADQMEQRGKVLAGEHTLSKSDAPDRLLRRLDDNETILIETRSLLTTAVKEKLRIAPAGEWLLDNYYLIEEQIRTARQHLPKDYSRELPRLAQGPSRGLPRVYDLALEAISHGDGRVDSEILSRFVAAYQTVTPLTLGELWTIPIMLRLALIENLRRVGARITTARIHFNQAQAWADRMMVIAESDPKSLILVIADMARSNPPMVSPFVAELARRLQGHGPSLALPLTWIEQRLAESSLTIEQMVLSENQQQAADQVSISNTIGSLRFLGAMDWRVFVETMSFVEQVLLEDLGGVYHGMDFATRDRYRHVVDRLAKRSQLSETAIAREAIGLAHRNATTKGANDHSAHVGYYLIDRGLPQLEYAVKALFSPDELLRQWLGRFPLTLYLGAILLMTVLFAGGLLAQAHGNGVDGWRLVLLGILSLLGSSQLASALVNWLATLLMKPHLLPRMDFSRGLPPDMRTLAVIPTLLSSTQSVEALLEALEVGYLGNQDGHLHFGLLTDFRDAQEEALAEDEPLLRLARAGIEKLNEKYPDSECDRFFLFHRPRRWNPSERIWMGYERKRGKLADLNALLRGSGRGNFSLIVGDAGGLADVRYVVTLDTDTQLPRDSVRQFVGAMAHPLNRPRYDEDRQRVCGGYGILQPRIAANLSGANRSLYARLCGSEPGIDPYTRSVSDVYQDLFGEGSFIGKGIYDVDAFERALQGRFPENQILSHDLLEGCYARSGLLSDVHLFEEYPARYQADVKRQLRWLRGDWQIAHWMLPYVPGMDRRKVRNPLSLLSRWKIFDNLRRSLAQAALVPLLLLGWFVLPQPWFWTLAVAGIVLIPPFMACLVDAFRKPREALLSQHLAAVLHSAGRNFALAGFRIACLPYEALLSLGAILRTAWRTMFTHRRLLEWCVSGEQDYRVGPGGPAAEITSSYRSMWSAPFVAVSVAMAAIWSGPEVLAAAGPVLCLWLAAPAIAWWLSRPLVRREVKLTVDQTIFLRKIARKTWGFFESFVVAEDHWLPPDNFQEHPGPVIAHRTSPTNMGLALLANLSAHDFGFIPAGSLIERTANAFHTMTSLERHQGHFYNWYDTRSLQPLPPRYISSVDSGNLAGHLLTLRAGLIALPDQNIVGARLFDGLVDTLSILADTAPETVQAPIARLQALLNTACTLRPATLPEVLQCLEPVASCAAILTASLDTTPEGEAKWWADVFVRQCRDALDELRFLAPWLVLLPAAPHFPDKYPDKYADLGVIPTLRDLAGRADKLLPALDARLNEDMTPEEQVWHGELRRLITAGSNRASERIENCDRLVQQATELASMEYEFLYDRARHLLAIGYNVDEYRRDTSFYDLLASEARLCTFVAIAQGQLPQESWFALGRLLTTAGGEPILMSWSGSMFEYLMPLLVMPAYDGTLLDQTCRSAVARQIAYGSQRSLPWGVSESGYNTVDANLNFQYRAFGVPGLGLKRGLADDMVVAPYASALALMVTPEAACVNLQRLAACGLEGRFGFYEAIDYTPSRLARGQSSVVVRSFMAHHQGMNLLSLTHLILDRPMQRRFESDPLFQAAMLLLQERIPRNSVIRTRVGEHEEDSAFSDAPGAPVQTPIGAETPTPEVKLLSNGRYNIMVTNAGGGYSRWKDRAVTRWREDSTCDNWGTFIYLRDVSSGDYWSATHQPTLKRAESYEAMFSEGRAEYRRRDHDYEAYSEIVVSPEDDIELRRVRITNHSRVRRIIEVTSYAEVVLAAPAADAMQPSFGNLFVQTEIIPTCRAILCTRRPRSVSDQTPWMFHLMATHGADIGKISYETDRMRFIGRGRTVAAPLALSGIADLSGSEGSVLDPIVAIRCRIVIEPGQSATIDLVSGASNSREACMELVKKYQDRHLADRAFDLAWTHSSVNLRQINATEADAQLYGRLAGFVLYANAALRAEAGIIMQNRRGQSGLWGYAISGDLPIVLLKIADEANINLARQMIQCHAYWRLKGLAVDLVIWNEDHVGYRHRLQDLIVGLIATGTEANAIDRPGGIFVRSAEQISNEDRILLQAVARVIIADSHGSLVEQVNRRGFADKRVARLRPTRAHRPEPAALPDTPRQDLILGNDLGGFTADGSEYVITTVQAQMTPMPWVNVIANPGFGTVVSESGLAYTWSENAHEFRLTPWSNDPVGTSGGEAFYLRDEESGHFWSPTPLPSRGAMPYLSRHGFGYSVFEHTAGGIHSELWVYVDLEEAVKFSVLKVRNGSGRMRRLSATGYVEWVLGDLRPKTAMHVVTEIDPASGALFARNAYNTEFVGRVAFFDVDDISRTLTGNRTEFLGRNGTLENPAGLSRTQLSGKVGPAQDPCGAIQVPFDLADGQEREIIFRLGAGIDLEQARKLAQRMRKTGTARNALEKVRQYWTHTLGAVQIETPDPSLNVLANGWLLYQTLACRLWARSGFYQSGGAFGFRDQLQDVMALVHAEPRLVREHLLRCAGRQYPEGDVQHWWHPPYGRGVRTRCSDDYLWLPLATCRYVLSSGDTGVLDESVHFLEGRTLGVEEESYSDMPGHSTDAASLYEHCVRAILQGLRFGEHGLPLMGSGDWNDGMNLVGIHGKGESVWLAFFLYEVLMSFAELAHLHDDPPIAERCRKEAQLLRRNIEQHAWDGAWYRRAYFDDGSPLGSSSNHECTIDSISQSWSVLSGAGDLERSSMAMDAMDRRLVRRDHGLIQLLDPPFDKSAMNPGYIKGYVPGVRENGGQYTHAAVWAAMAFAALGDSRRAWELLALINPLNHVQTAQAVDIYKTEPYVVAADVYAIAPHTGRGGWTWYTGSAGWLYRLIVESLLGLKLEDGRLRFTPCIPEDWTEFSLRYRYCGTTYRISILQMSAAEGATVTLDGIAQTDNTIPLTDDHLDHTVEVRIKPSRQGEQGNSGKPPWQGHERGPAGRVRSGHCGAGPL
ncbi:MAG: cyclic beta 1-2 glucan synthetase [Gammaproteobacteria bacterium]|nr:cyclic beta 1-2 glucan synthetase [Gammaproteobacteria bacterium]